MITNIDDGDSAGGGGDGGGDDDDDKFYLCGAVYTCRCKSMRMRNLVIFLYIIVHMSVYVCMYRHICVRIWLCHACPYVYILRLYVLYDYVQRCEDTFSVELLYIDESYYCLYFINSASTLPQTGTQPPLQCQSPSDLLRIIAFQSNDGI